MKDLAYKLFPNLYIHKVSKDHTGIFHSLTLKTTFISSILIRPLWDFFQNLQMLRCAKSRFSYLKEINSILQQLIKEKILVKEGYNYKDEINSIKKKVISQKPRLALAYFIVSELCNLNCKYCHIERGMPPFYKKINMPLKTALENAAFFSINAYRREKKTPVAYFYGGEPLLNFNAIKLIYIFIRKYESKINSKARTKFVLVTNGTLITKEIAKFLVKAGINVAISIDGFKNIHDKQRINLHRNSGSFREVLRGYNVLKKEGGKPGISCTVNRYNVAFLPKIAEYFASELKPSSVGFNLMYEHLDGKNPSVADIDKVSISLIRTFEILRYYGIYEDRIGRHLTSQGDVKFHYYDCAGCGDQLVFSPTGDFGPCHAFLPSKKYFFGNLYKKTGDVFCHPVLKLWRGHTPFNMPKCIFCPAISICGGGCAYESYIKTGSLFARDERYCRFYNKHFLKWYIEDRYKNSKENLKNKNKIEIGAAYGLS